MNLSIKTKFIAASLAIVALVSGLIFSLLSVQNGLEVRMTEMIQKNLTGIRMAEQIKYNVVLYDDLVFRYLATDEKSFLDEAVAALDSAETWIGRMKDVVEGAAETELLAAIESDISRYSTGIKKIITVYQAQPKAPKGGLLNMFFGEAEVILTDPKKKESISSASFRGKTRLIRINSRCESMVEIHRAKLEMAQNQMREKIYRIKRMVIVVGSLAFLAAVVIVSLLALEILAPIRRLLSGVQQVALGDLDIEIPVSGSDEIGRLTHHFNSMTRSIKEKQERLRNETITDPLTGLHNLRYFQEHLKNEIIRAQRHGHPFSLLVVDIDHFKNYNDKNGHQAGNIILKEIASLFKESLRGDEVTARYGGEEFAFILPETSAQNARAAAERLRHAVEKCIFPGQEKQPLGKITVSIGGATFPENGSTASELFEKADQALYKAKEAGRNRIHWA